LLKKMTPTKTASCQNLKNHCRKIKNIHMQELFKTNPQRFRKFSIRFNDIIVDYSKNRITDETLQIFRELAEEVDLRDAIEKMFTGDKINETENRAALHTALRNRGNTPIYVDRKDVMPEVNEVLKKMEKFSHQIITGEWRGFSGKKISAIENIGIGGSDLGPVMVAEL